MSDRNRATEPDSPPHDGERPATDIEHASDDGAEASEVVPSDDRTPLEPTGVPDGNSGTGGVVKNQDEMAQ